MTPNLSKLYDDKKTTTRDLGSVLIIKTLPGFVVFEATKSELTKGLEPKYRNLSGTPH